MLVILFVMYDFTFILYPPRQSVHLDLDSSIQHITIRLLLKCRQNTYAHHFLLLFEENQLE